MNHRNERESRSELSMLPPNDELASYEYGKNARRRILLEPEKRLAFAVLEDGIYTFQRLGRATSKRDRKLYRQAVEWIFGKDNQWVFSFENICDICGIDADFLRMGLNKWQAQTGRRPALEQARHYRDRLRPARNHG